MGFFDFLKRNKPYTINDLAVIGANLKILIQISKYDLRSDSFLELGLPFSMSLGKGIGFIINIINNNPARDGDSKIDIFKQGIVKNEYVEDIVKVSSELINQTWRTRINNTIKQIESSKHEKIRAKAQRAKIAYQELQELLPALLKAASSVTR